MTGGVGSIFHVHAGDSHDTLHNDNYKSALVSFNSVIDMDPNNIKAQFQKANTLSKLEKFDDAVDIYTDLLKASRSSDYINWVWESPRYKNIYADLLSGCEYCSDNTNSFFIKELDSNQNIAIFLFGDPKSWI